MTIKILSNTTINRIAAGEVVERPASAIKELVENSIDAKASKIDVIIENAGRNMITIIDDGIGMNKQDLEWYRDYRIKVLKLNHFYENFNEKRKGNRNKKANSRVYNK